MKTRTKKMLSLLLATAMVFTMNTFAFAEEVADVDSFAEEISFADVEEVPAADVYVDTTTPSTPSSASEWNPTVSADKVLSENAAAISENLAVMDTMEFKAGSTTVYAVFPRAIAFGGKTKPGSKNFPISVKFYQPKAGASVSAADLVSWNESKHADEITSASFDEIPVKKAKFKAAKGATVGLDGKGLCTVNKATFLQSVTFEKSVDKTLKKALSKAVKDNAKAVKKDKTSKVSANGIKDGDKDPYSGVVVAVYPAYAGNDDEAVKVAGLAGLKVLTGVDTSKVAKKKITGTGDGKKVTLKLTKKPEKPKGFGAEQTTTADTNSKKATKYVVADGNFAGNIYY